jgi:hypothetical protein
MWQGENAQGEASNLKNHLNPARRRPFWGEAQLVESKNDLIYATKHPGQTS